MIYDGKAKNRLKRIEGQLRGIVRMMEEEKDCKDVVTQLTAARTAIDRTMAVIVSSNLEQCIRDSIETGKESSQLIDEAVGLLVKSR